MKKRLLKKRIESLEAELGLMKSIVPMTDSQRNAFIAAVIIIGEKLNEA